MIGDSSKKQKKTDVFIVLFLDNLIEIRSLPKLCLDWSLRELETGNQKEKLLKRMLALTSLKGGIPNYSLHKFPDLKRPVKKFESIGIHLDHWKDEIDFVENNSGVLYAMTNYKRLRSSGPITKEELLACFWDHIIGPCMIEGSRNANFSSETNYNLKSFLGTCFDVFSDWVLIIKSINLPVFFIEILPEFSAKEDYEKGITKIYLELTESCKRLAKEFIERGLNAKNIRVFGLLIWRSEMQFCTAHPSIILKKDSNEIEEISINLTGYGNENWYYDTLEYKQAFLVGLDYDRIMRDARKMMQDRIISKESLCKLKLFLKSVFFTVDYQTTVLELGFSKSMKYPNNPSIPKPKPIKIMNPSVYYSIPNSFKLFFPLLQNDKNEKLEEISKNVCKDSLRKHLLDACTFAVHVLFELSILHEEAGYVHSNINCESIKFSPLLKIWKLANFEEACKIEESKKTVRIVGTTGFISPESNKTGIFTEASDVFALGKVLSRMFYLEMAYEIELSCGTVCKSDVKAVDEFFEIICKMCAKDLKERFLVKEALKEFYILLKKYEIEGFFLYGTNLIFPLIEKMFE